MATLQVEPREKASSAAANRLRNGGTMPMALLTKKDGTKLIQANRAELKELFGSITGLAMFDIEGKSGKSRVMLKDVQRDPVTRKVTHVTVQEVEPSDIVKVHIPVHVEGVPAAVTKKVATLMTPTNQIFIQAAVKDLPERITVDASGLGQNDRVAVSDLGLGDSVTILTSGDTVLAATKQLRGMADMGDEAEATGEATEEAGPDAGEATAEEEAPAEE